MADSTPGVIVIPGIEIREKVKRDGEMYVPAECFSSHKENDSFSKTSHSPPPQPPFSFIWPLLAAKESGQVRFLSWEHSH